MSDSTRCDVADTPRHAMSVDVEDWFQVWALSSVIERADWENYALRVHDTTSRILDLFDRHDVKATFFVLGWVAERCPETIRALASAGHEIASHGYDHTKVFDQMPDEFRADVIRTKSILEDVTGVPIRGYRAAGFSMDGRTPHAHRILGETGHSYSSSSHPIAHDHYGDPNAPMGPYAADRITEIPVAVVEMMGRRQTCAGGGWFRAMPYAASQYMWRALERSGRNGVFYFHPWEIDPGQPKVAGLPLKSRLRHRLNLQHMETKLERLVGDFSWGRIDEVFADKIAAPVLQETPCPA
ncbi:XrtA system polysaccharide deacetylase [Parvularcula sp. LCG005]|uniref:XrtA system polysaccharide deacetylase n=1 Tax=Parvularcula sp. LCG005 TaxID=3078805 RepID=UPI002941C618|nr:XrtA system polysaccharide deacetylase [Parvularcula sp. LCG005]WOI52523.1 DUF3473 domain-containing protein [Parvularcula sp. LCG005]